MIKQSIITIATLGLFTVTASAYDTKGCVSCHGANFETAKVFGSESRAVKDMTSEEIVVALTAYKDGTHKGSKAMMMKGQVAPMSEEDIKTVADALGKKAEEKK
ncbi:MAG: Unknown protein [uncultured Sulfurovum sp.]|uniref:Cytochrome c domain-containing protein n=1 Tax=uncultured Sulfurovum sp. TaxID=269237 RepID=A0A6S6S0A7_9BACT|nr:MAG: Unknown protein [uncultured Sulfurovum sp.]